MKTPVRRRYSGLTHVEEGKTTGQRLACRHGGKAIVVDCDGGTALVTPDEIRAFDQRGGASHPFWKADEP